MPIYPLLPWLAALTASLSIASAPWALDNEWLNFIFKPATTLLLIAWAWPRGAGDAVRPFVRAGLGLSLAGDVALMWPEQGFLPGLISFLLAHISYIVAFTRHSRLAARPAWLLGYGVLAAAVLTRLWPGVPAPLQIPVLVYVSALALMAAQAAVQWRVRCEQAGAPDEATRRARLAALGGALFLLSDALLATNRFYAPLQASGLWILLSYWLAQGLITASMRGPRPGP